MKFNAKRHFRAARWRLERGFREFIVRNTFSAAPYRSLILLGDAVYNVNRRTCRFRFQYSS